MAFFKFRSAGQQGNETRSAPAAAAPAESVESMRRRARHRLVGAAVLVLIGVVGFPLLFDTQPRPVPGDIPIEIPDRNKSKPLSVPVAPAPEAKPEAAAKPERSSRVADSSADHVITERADGTEIAAQAPVSPPPKAEPKPEPKPEPKAESKPEPKPEPKAEAKPERKPEPKAEAKPEPKAPAKASTSDDAARARALLEGGSATQPAAADSGSRFVVQVGAFADAGKAREVRQKLEKAGLKTYTNVAKTSDGERTRVRVGPFASRADADKAAGKVKELALPAAVLTL